jgi:hypothetical protein
MKVRFRLEHENGWMHHKQKELEVQLYTALLEAYSAQLKALQGQVSNEFLQRQRSLSTQWLQRRLPSVRSCSRRMKVQCSLGQRA